MSLIRLLYRSDSGLTGSDQAVREATFAIADDAAARNDRQGVTGALMFTRGVFVQLLEGRTADVERVFERICRDPRHRRVVLLDYSEADERVFPGCGMVAFEGDERVRALFPPMTEPTSYPHRNRLSANNAIELMEALHARRSSQSRPVGIDRLVATDIMG